MRLDDLTPVTFGSLFRRMCRGYQRTIPATDIEGTIEVYFDAVRRFSTPVVEQAVTNLINVPTRYFPRAGDLAMKCRELEGEAIRRAGPTTTTDLDDRCSHCRAAFFYAGYELGNGNVVGRRRCDCRPQGQGWFTERAQAWRETGPMDGATAMADLKKILRPGKPAKRMGLIGEVLGDRGDAWEPTDEELERARDEKRERFRTAAQGDLS